MKPDARRAGRPTAPWGGLGALTDLRFVRCNAATIRAAARNPRADLGEWQAELGGASWPKADKRVLAYHVDALSLDPSSEPYLLWVAVFGSGIVGRIGCHFAPNSSGDVEIGYVVDKGWRGLRVANWMLDTFLATLAGMGVLPVTAAVAPGNRPSSTLLSRRGFRRFTKQLDPEDGVEHLYRFRYEPSLLGV